MKCQILFSGKNKKNNIILSSAENAQRVVKLKHGLAVTKQNKKQEANGPQCSPELTAVSLSGHLLIIPY